jgi:hypothetical protein
MQHCALLPAEATTGIQDVAEMSPELIVAALESIRSVKAGGRAAQRWVLGGANRRRSGRPVDDGSSKQSRSMPLTREAYAASVL